MFVWVDIADPHETAWLWVMCCDWHAGWRWIAKCYVVNGRVLGVKGGGGRGGLVEHFVLFGVCDAVPGAEKVGWLVVGVARSVGQHRLWVKGGVRSAASGV